MADPHESSGPQGGSCWVAPARAPAAPLHGAITADFAMLGAGFSGLAAAYFLKRAEPSARVVILDSGHVGGGASVKLTPDIGAPGGPLAEIGAMLARNTIDDALSNNFMLAVATSFKPVK